MTTTAPVGLDISGTASIPFSRLFRVELRKTVDTRAGRWLIGITIGAALLAEGIFLAVVATHDDATAQYGDFVGAAAFVSSILLPVVGVMLVTSEWSQRTAMTTFTLEPRRMRIVVAKLLAGVTLTAFVIVFALVVGLVCNLLYGALQSHQSIDWTFGWSGFAGFVINQTFAMLGGFALACLLLNTPAAIVVFFIYKWVLPGLFALGAALMSWFNSLVDWIDFQAAQNELYEMPLTGSQWAHLAVSGFIWLVIPLAIGIWRIRRAEVK
jgi:ABC-2 type transport system permease protein